MTADVRHPCVKPAIHRMRLIPEAPVDAVVEATRTNLRAGLITKGEAVATVRDVKGCSAYGACVLLGLKFSQAEVLRGMASSAASPPDATERERRNYGTRHFARLLERRLQRVQPLA